jgi:hypothetical protein
MPAYQVQTYSKKHLAASEKLTMLVLKLCFLHLEVIDWKLKIQ